MFKIVYHEGKTSALLQGVMRVSCLRRAAFFVHVFGIELFLCCPPDDLIAASGFGGELCLVLDMTIAVNACLHQC